MRRNGYSLQPSLRLKLEQLLTVILVLLEEGVKESITSGCKISYRNDSNKTHIRIWYRLHHGGLFCNIKWINLSLSVLSRPLDILVWVWRVPSHAPFPMRKSRGGGMNRSPEQKKKKKIRATSACRSASAPRIWNQAVTFFMFPVFAATAPRIWIHGLSLTARRNLHHPTRKQRMATMEFLKAWKQRAAWRLSERICGERSDTNNSHGFLSPLSSLHRYRPPSVSIDILSFKMKQKLI